MQLRSRRRIFSRICCPAFLLSFPASKANNQWRGAPFFRCMHVCSFLVVSGSISSFLTFLFCSFSHTFHVCLILALSHFRPLSFLVRDNNDTACVREWTDWKSSFFLQTSSSSSSVSSLSQRLSEVVAVYSTFVSFFLSLFMCWLCVTHWSPCAVCTSLGNAGKDERERVSAKSKRRSSHVHCRLWQHSQEKKLSLRDRDWWSEYEIVNKGRKGEVKNAAKKCPD